MKTRLGWPTWIGVVAEDLEAQRRFYREVLGLEETAHGEGWVQFGVGGRMFEVIARTGDPNTRLDGTKLASPSRTSMPLGTSSPKPASMP